MSETNFEKGDKVRARNGEVGVMSESRRRCQLHGCTGARLMVRWPDGTRTWPCSKGLIWLNGAWEIQ